MQAKELTTDQLRLFVREIVLEILDEYLDPDQGKALKAEVIERLRQQETNKEATIPAMDAMQQLGINWDEL